MSRILFDNFLPDVLRQGLWMNTAEITQLAQGIPYFHLQNAGTTTPSGIYAVSTNPNSSPHTCIASTLPTETPLQTLSL